MRLTLRILVLGLAPVLTGGAGLGSAPPVWEDGPWIPVPPGATVYEDALTEADLVRLADLDGDPSVITEDERAMIAGLREVLLPVPADGQPRPGQP